MTEEMVKKKHVNSLELAKCTFLRITKPLCHRFIQQKLLSVVSLQTWCSWQMTQCLLTPSNTYSMGERKWSSVPPTISWTVTQTPDFYSMTDWLVALIILVGGHKQDHMLEVHLLKQSSLTFSEVILLVNFCIVILQQTRCVTLRSKIPPTPQPQLCAE